MNRWGDTVMGIECLSLAGPNEARPGWTDAGTEASGGEASGGRWPGPLHVIVRLDRTIPASTVPARMVRSSRIMTRRASATAAAVSLTMTGEGREA